MGQILTSLQPDVVQLYQKYDTELRVLTRKLRTVFHSMQSKGHGTTFGDVEGELMYMLIREYRPNIAFEISPDCGWSTNYILAALTANRHGVLHTFELAPKKYGEPTESVVRNNQHSDWDQSRLILHLGDARTTVPTVEGQIDFLLMDSCHDDWFAKWYIDKVFPRVHGTVIVQDIVFVDQLEPSSEARHVWEWLEQERMELTLVGALEAEPKANHIRAGYAERRNLRSNSIVFMLPNSNLGVLPQLVRSPEQLLEQAQVFASQGERAKADQLVTEASRLTLYSLTRVNRHRLLVKAAQIYQQIGESDEAGRAYQRALGVVMQADLQQRVKGLAELFKLFVINRRWGLGLQACFLLLFAGRNGLRRLFHTIRNMFRSLWRQVKR